MLFLLVSVATEYYPYLFCACGYPRDWTRTLLQLPPTSLLNIEGLDHSEIFKNSSSFDIHISLLLVLNLKQIGS